jgi:hypothetical protein
VIWRRLSVQVSAEGREEVNIWRERLKMRFEDMRCCRCCSSSRSGRVVAFDVEQMSVRGLRWKRRPASVSANFR